MQKQTNDLRARRKRLGITQTHLAKAFGLSRQTIAQREAGKCPITRETEFAMLLIEGIFGSLSPQLSLARARLRTLIEDEGLRGWLVVRQADGRESEGRNPDRAGRQGAGG